VQPCAGVSGNAAGRVLTCLFHGMLDLLEDPLHPGLSGDRRGSHPQAPSVRIHRSGFGDRFLMSVEPRTMTARSLVKSQGRGVKG
jgi:hypothetical protein